MNILTFDTSTNTLRVGLSTPMGFYENIRSVGLKHGESLMLLTDSIMTEAGLKMSDLNLIVCTRGPGSFTGLRIGISTAKGLAEGSGCPMVSVSSLEIYGSFYKFFPGIVIPLIDAKKNHFYTCRYFEGKAVSEEMDISADEIISLCSQDKSVLFTGPGTDVFRNRIPGENLKPYFHLDSISINSFCGILATLGIEKFRVNGEESPESGPVYLRASDAEIGRNNKND